MHYNSVAEFLLSFVVNSTICLGVAWGIDKGLRTRAENRLWLWNLAMLVALGLSVASHLPNTKIQCQLPHPSSLYVNYFFYGKLFHQSTYSFCLATLLSWCWLCGAGVGLIAWARKVFQVQSALQERTPVHDPRLLGALDQARRALNIRRPIHLSMHPSFVSPVALGANEICMSKDSLNMDESHLRAILGHELAHTERKDYLKLPLIALLRCFFWFAPLWSLFEAARNQYVEEICDKSGARACGTAHQMASALVAVAQSGRAQRSFLPGLTTRKGGLPRRVQALLLSKTRSSSSKTRTVFCLSVGATALILFQVFAPPLTMSVSDASGCNQAAAID